MRQIAEKKRTAVFTVLFAFIFSLSALLLWLYGNTNASAAGKDPVIITFDNRKVVSQVTMLNSPQY